MGGGAHENCRFAGQESLFPVFHDANYHSDIHIGFFE